MHYIKDILSRIGHLRGFGIQSPWAYSFVREVIAERLPYYAYQEIDESLEHQSRRFRKLVKLYFRIVNSIQPDFFVDITSDNLDIMPFVELGCRKMSFKKDFNTLTNYVSVVRLSLAQTENKEVISLSQQLCNGSAIILDGINFSRETKVKWNFLREEDSLHVVFDLIDTAIVYIDRKMNKAVYKLNF